MTTLSSPPPGQTRVGGYRLLAVIGEGGMGVVHLAQGKDGRRVALKVLRQHVVGDCEARERLAREVHSLKRISSPRIAEILDADPHGPVPFVATRYVPGLSLYHHVAEEGPVRGRDLLHFADALAEALQAVHRVGVLHRDIKPTNVLMEGRSPVLIDFGLARLAEDPRLTQTGWLLGTPGYLAPEILYGDDATAASDVHAWAATSVFAATGRAPYGTGPAMAIMDRVRRGEYDVSGVPEPLDQLLRECLDPEPLARPSVPELRARLADLRHHRQRPHLGKPVQPDQDHWTMPYSPVPSSDAAAAPTDLLPPQASAEGIPVRRATPYQQPAPPVEALDPPTASPTRMLPATSSVVPAGYDRAHHAPARPGPDRPEPDRPEPDRLAQAGPDRSRRDTSRVQRVFQLLGLGAVTSALVAYAPSAGTALVAASVLLLRTASVTRQRHGRRRSIRGRARWYDVPTTTLSLPGYLLFALVGTLAMFAVAAICGLAMFGLGYLLGRPLQVNLLFAGLGSTAAVWWGPGSARVREMTRGMVARTGATEFGGWLTITACLLGTTVLVGLLFGGGPNWAPGVGAPWR